MTVDWKGTYAKEFERKARPVSSRNGSVWSYYTESPIEKVRERRGKTSNPVKRVPGPDGSVFVFRKSSSYYREARVVRSNKPNHGRNPNGVRESYSFGAGGGNQPELPWALMGPMKYSSTDNLWARCNTECLNKLADSKGQLMNDLLEAVRTYNSLAGRAAQAARFLLALKRGNFSAAGRELFGHSFRSSSKKAADAWLEYQFAWKPLAETLYNYQEELRRPNQMYMMKATRRLSESNTFDRWESTRQHFVENCTRSVQQTILAGLTSESVQFAKRWGLLNPLSIGWEAVPWSFAIDWFLPIGNVLEAYTAPFGLQFLTGSRTTRQTNKQVLTTVWWTGWWSVLLENGVREAESIFLNREELTAFPGADLYVKSPFSTAHGWNAIALVRQLVG